MWRALFLSLLACAAAWGLTPDQVVVVYNADSALSTRTAKEYARLRHISVQQLVPLRGLPKERDLSRSDFERLVRSPLLYAGACNDWHWPAQGRRGGVRNMYAMVLMPDLPLRVKESDEVNRRRSAKFQAQKAAGQKAEMEWTPDEAAAVDSELMLLGAEYPLRSGLMNPYYEKSGDITSANPPVMAVTRIDGPDEACIRREIQDPVRVEREGLWGWVVVDEGGPYPPGERMFRTAADGAKSQDQPLFYETSKKMLADAFPLSNQTAVYFGWYTEFANGPFAADAPADFRFVPGAIAGHLHSFSCPNLKDEKRWAPALLKRGAAVSFGNVYEPFLQGCHDFGVFYDRLLKGYTVAEAQLMATPMISWQEVVFGDPLYRPFAAQREGRAPVGNAFAEWRELVRNCNECTDAIDAAVKARAGRPEGATLLEALAWRYTEEKQYARAAEAFRMAANASSRPADKLRNTLMQISLLHSDGERRQARELMLNCLSAYANSPYRPAVEATADSVVPDVMAERRKNASPKK